MEVSTWIVGVVVIVLLYCMNHRFRNAKFKHLQSLPGPRRIPIFGNYFEMFGLSKVDVYKMLLVHSKKSELGMWCFWVGSRACVYLHRADTVECVLSNPRTIDKDPMYALLHDWLGTGILCSSGEKWQRRRKLLTPTFHFSILEQFLPIMNSQVKVLVEKIQRNISEGIDIENYLSSCTLDVICETAMGVKLNAQANAENPVADAMKEIDEIITQRIWTPFWIYDTIFQLSKTYKRYVQCLNTIHGFTLDVISDRKKLLANAKTDEIVKDQPKKKAFLDLLLETGELGKEALKEEVNTFILAGHDTSTVTAKFCLFILGHNMDIQDKVFDELEEIFQDSDRDATMEDIRSMKYLERCIKESLRLYPSIPYIGRLLTEPVDINGLKLPTGTAVSIDFYTLHRDEKYFPNPDVFDPDRFLPEKTAGRHPYSYIPFSAGSRNCIGQKFGMLEAKIILSTILRRFKVKSLLRRDEVNFPLNITLKSKETIYLKFSPRI